MIHIEKTESGEYRVSSDVINCICETFGGAISEVIDQHDKGNI